MWLRDSLPADLPNHRAILYGYDTKLQGSQSKQSIHDLGVMLMGSIAEFRHSTQTTQRPIVFIGHSLGGLVVKEALVHAHRLGNKTNLCQACHAILLFGVPNLGLRYDQLRTIVKDNPNKALIESLLVDGDSEPSDYMRRISDQVSESCTGYDYEVVTFYERRLTLTLDVGISLKNMRHLLILPFGSRRHFDQN